MVPSVARPGRTLDVSVQVFKEGSHQVYAKMVQTNIEERLVQIIANSSTTIGQYCVNCQYYSGNRLSFDFLGCGFEYSLGVH